MVKSLKEKLSKGIFLVSALFGVFAVLTIIIYLLCLGVPAIAEIGFFQFVFGTEWFPQHNKYGILPMIVNTLYVTGFSVLIGVGFGVFTAIFMAKFCPKKVYKVLRQVINLLAGIPSVVYGFFGVQVLVPLFSGLSPNGVGYGLLCSALILGIMILPTVVAISLNAIESVPQSYYEGAIALGATHEQAVFKVVIPAAKSGIMASVILAIGRGMGETMAIVMVSGNIPAFAEGLFGGFRTLTGNIVFEMAYAEGLHLGALIATGVVLFVFILVITIGFNAYLTRRKKRDRKRQRNLVGQTVALSTLNYQQKCGLSKLFKILSYVGVSFTVLFLGFIVVFIFVSGIPHLSFGLIFGNFSYDGPPTMLPAIVTTLMLIGTTMLIAIPIGVFAAIYLVEYTKRGSKLVKVIRTGVETLSGIPSIIFGLFGMLMFCNAFGFGYSILAGSLTLVLMILPTVIRATEEALKAVPDSFREASLALGASKTRTIFKIVLPSAMSGIITSIILSVGRIIGESAAVIYTVGGTFAMPNGIMSSGVSLSVFMYLLAGEGFHVNEAYAVAVVLLIIVALLNFVSSFIESTFKKKVKSYV